MYCKHCGKEINDDALFCNSCGAKVNDSVAPYINDSAPYGEKKGISTFIIVAGLIIAALVAFVIWFRQSKDIEAPAAPVQAEQSNYPTNYEKYLGEWKVYGSIGHPDGDLARRGDYIIFTEKGIDCTNLFGHDESWSVIGDIKYYNEDGNDYYVDPMGDPVGFYYDPTEDEIIIYTPSTNYPSDNPYNWNSRLRLKRN